MLRTDFENHKYTAEVLRTSKPNVTPAKRLEPLLAGTWQAVELPQDSGPPIVLHHGFVGSNDPHHRAPRKRINDRGKEQQIPRREKVGNSTYYLYDVLLTQRGNHIVVAVPFVSLAASVFVSIDKRLAGTGTLYEKLDITKIIVHLAAARRTDQTPDRDIAITQCQLAYEDPESRRRQLDHVRLTGDDLGATDIYQQLITPVLDPSTSEFDVTPVMLGFASRVGGVRKSSATTDRYGNFRVHVGPGLRQILRIFDLLDDIEAIRGVVSATANVPILQARIGEEEA